LLEHVVRRFLELDAVRRLSNLDFNIFKNSDWRKKEWHTTTDGRTGNGLSGKKLRKKYCGSMELMKPSLNKSAQTTGQTSIPTGGFTIGQATSANTLRGWQTGNRIPS